MRLPGTPFPRLAPQRPTCWCGPSPRPPGGSTLHHTGYSWAATAGDHARRRWRACRAARSPVAGADALGGRDAVPVGDLHEVRHAVDGELLRAVAPQHSTAQQMQHTQEDGLRQSTRTSIAKGPPLITSCYSPKGLPGTRQHHPCVKASHIGAWAPHLEACLCAGTPSRLHARTCPGPCHPAVPHLGLEGLGRIVAKPGSTKGRPMWLKLR